MALKSHLVEEYDPKELSDLVLRYPKDKFDLISIDRVYKYDVPYTKQIAENGKKKEYHRFIYKTLISVKCKHCGTIKQVIDDANMGCKEGPCNIHWRDLTGRRFGNIVAESYEYVSIKNNSKPNWYWKCKCDCGNICYKTAHALLYSGTKYCPGCAIKDKADRIELADGGAAWNSVYTITKHNAAARGYTFDLTPEQVRDICSKPCYYCGAVPSIPLLTGKYKQHLRGYRNGIDRFDNTRGYTVDNCVPCCFVCNAMKSDNAYEAWITHMCRILDKHKERSTTIPEGSTPKRVEKDSD